MTAQSIEVWAQAIKDGIAAGLENQPDGELPLTLLAQSYSGQDVQADIGDFWPNMPVIADVLIPHFLATSLPATCGFALGTWMTDGRTGERSEGVLVAALDRDMIVFESAQVEREPVRIHGWHRFDGFDGRLRTLAEAMQRALRYIDTVLEEMQDDDSDS